MDINDEADEIAVQEQVRFYCNRIVKRLQSARLETAHRFGLNDDHSSMVAIRSVLELAICGFVEVFEADDHAQLMCRQKIHEALEMLRGENAAD